MSNLDPRIEAVRVQYGLSASDFWELPQRKGTWVAKHAALEVAAAKAGIAFDMPQIIEHDAEKLVTSLVVQGVMGDRREWATGETNPSNYRVSGKQPSYPWAMSEKRAKDRVILKLIGIHGLAYSDAEGDFNEAPQQAEPATLPKAKSREIYTALQNELNACGTLDELAGVWIGASFQAEFKKMHPDFSKMLTDHKDDLKVTLQGGTSEGGYVPPVFDKENA